MAHDFSSAKIFKTGGTNKMFTFATGAPSTALEAQGHEVSANVSNAAMGFTNGSVTVTYGLAASSHDEKIIVSNEDLKAYRITSVSAGSSYTLDRAYTGSTATHNAMVFPGPSVGSPSINPQHRIIG